MFFKKRPVLTTICIIALVIALLITSIVMFPDILYFIRTRYRLADIGDTVYFGKYEQSGYLQNGPDDIEWIVLDKDKDEGKLLLITKKQLFHTYYCEDPPATWDGSHVRSELNSEFYDAAFSEEEKQRIVTTRLEPEQNPYYGTDPGTATEDKVFILSASEAEKYFASDSDRCCLASRYLYECSLKTIDHNAWWLRTPGKNAKHAVCVSGIITGSGELGSIDYEGESCSSSLCIRPVIWLSIE